MSDRAVCDLIPLLHGKGASLPGRRHTGFIKTERQHTEGSEEFLLRKKKKNPFLMGDLRNEDLSSISERTLRCSMV